MKKKVLLILPNFFKLNEPIKQNLEFCGFEVTDKIYDLEKPFKYAGFRQRARNFFLKTFLKKKDHKIKLVMQNNNRLIEDAVSVFPMAYFDFSLFLTVQFFDSALIRKVRTKSKKTIAYQFDSIKRTPELKKNIPLFDAFYSFDKKDSEEYGVKFISNFYFDHNLKSQYPKSVDFFYIGTFVPERLPILLKMADAFKEGGYSFEAMLFAHKKEELIPYLNYGIKSMDRLLTYEEQETLASRARVLIDLKLSVHDGLSFRFFESMKFKSKIITTNSTVKEYDFYSDKNILVIEGPDVSANAISTLINTPFDTQKQKAFENYSFSNWIKKILR